MGNDQNQALQKGFTSSLSIESLDDVARAAKMIFQSGAFGNLNNPQEAGAKIMTGLELGLSPMTAIRNIYFFDGAVTLSGPLLASLIRQHSDYDYKILGSNSEGAKVRFYRKEIVDGEPKWVPQKPDVQFTKGMAKKAGLFEKENWQNYPEDMYVWRCIARGKRWHCPEVGMGSIYIKDEIESGTVEDVEPVEEIKRDEPEGGSPDPENVEALPESAENVEGAPDFDEKAETSETKVRPKEPEDTTPPEPKTKPLNPEEGARTGEPAGKPTSERTAPGNVPSNGESPDREKADSDDGNTPDASEDEVQRRKAILPEYIVESDSVRIDLLGESTVQEIRRIHESLSGTETGNDLLKTIQGFREHVSEEYPDEATVDRAALDLVLDEHLNRIGTGPAKVDEPEKPKDKPEESGGESGGESEIPIPELPDDHADPVADVSTPGMPWFDTVGRRFREDMEKTRSVLLDEVAKRGITPIDTRLKEFKERFEKAGPTGQMKEEFDLAIAPFETALSMRQALIKGDDPEIDVFNRAINDFLETAESLDNPKRKARAERIVFREAKRLEDRFESLTLEFHEDDEDEVEGSVNGQTGSGGGESAGDGTEEGEETGEEAKEDPIPDIPLPPGFPKLEKLHGADINRTGEVSRRIREGTLTDVNGVGPASVEKIADFLREIAEVPEDEDLGF